MPQAHDLPTPDLYTPTATEPTTLTDPPAAHGAHGVSSEAAQQLALVIHDSFIRTTDFELSMNRIAMMFDAFAAQAVAAEQGRIKRVAQFLAANTTQRDVRDYVYVGDLLGSIDGGFNPPIDE